MFQSEEDDDSSDEKIKSPFGSSFRTFDATDYKPIGKLYYDNYILGRLELGCWTIKSAHGGKDMGITNTFKECQNWIAKILKQVSV